MNTMLLVASAHTGLTAETSCDPLDSSGKHIGHVECRQCPADRWRDGEIFVCGQGHACAFNRLKIPHSDLYGSGMSQKSWIDGTFAELADVAVVVVEPVGS